MREATERFGRDFFMPRDMHCPHCGQVIVLDSRPTPHDAAALPNVAHTIETIIPGTFCGDEAVEPTNGDIPNGSTDRLGFSIEENLDPFDLHDSASHEAFPALRSGSSEFDPLLEPVADPHLGGCSNGEPIETDLMADVPHPEQPSEESTRLVAKNDRHTKLSHDSLHAKEQGREDREEVETAPWSWILLGSYASAVTLALIWVLWNGPSRGKASGETLPIPARSNPTKRSAMLPPLSKDRVTSLRIPLTVGLLEFTPLEISAGPAPLDGDMTRDGNEALILRARFKNLSKTETFAPLRRDYVRLNDTGESEAWIFTGSEPIESYPLAVDSERFLLGQNFDDLPPGETMETILVSDHGFRTKLTPAMMWRIKLQVGPNRAETVGLSFHIGDIP